MCILCVVHRWSRRVAAMLPWLVIPLILIWAFSQLFPPNFRFEVTSPRLACVVVLVITLFWYEFLMPQLSVWRARRNERMREKRRNRAIELQIMKKSATRRCRNCLTPYRDQKPGGGKFMCGYCGHVSKRPVLDLPGWQDWSGGSRFWGNGVSGGDGRCLTEKSYSGVLVFGVRLVGSFYFSLRWVWRKVFRVGSREGDMEAGESKGLSNRRGDNGGNFQESRVEKAKRKAEEKRQARLEREMLEEEERKQREEVARLVEERRRLRDEILEAEKPRSKGSASVDGERESRKEAERRRRERRKEKDKGSSKSNSDVEELERKAGRENDRKRDFDKRSEIERQKSTVENLKSLASEGCNGSKVAGNKTRYIDRMKGTLLSSSKGFSGASFFGRNTQPAVNVTKVSKPAAGVVDHGQNSAIRNYMHPGGSTAGKLIPNGDHKPVGVNIQPQPTAPKKSWHQLFTRSSAVSPDPDTNNTTFGYRDFQLEASSALDQRVYPGYSVDNQYNFRQSSPGDGCSLPNSLEGYWAPNAVSDSMFPPLKEPIHNSVVEDTELYEDPCYVPDPRSLLGPVSDQLDTFPLDIQPGFVEQNKVKDPYFLKKLIALAELSKPSPIESPLSRSRVPEERQFLCTPEPKKLHAYEMGESGSVQGPGTWQMWGTPSARDGLGLGGRPSSWFSSSAQSKSNQEDVTHPLAHSPMRPQTAMDDPLPSILATPKTSVNLQNGGTFSPLGPGLNGNDPWAQDSPFQSPLPMNGDNHFLPLDLIENIAENEVTYSTPKSSAAVHPFDVPSTNGWSKEDWEAHGLETAKSTSPVRPPDIGGLFSTGPDVQSVWSFSHQ